MKRNTVLLVFIFAVSSIYAGGQIEDGKQKAAENILHLENEIISSYNVLNFATKSEIEDRRSDLQILIFAYRVIVRKYSLTGNDEIDRIEEENNSYLRKENSGGSNSLGIITPQLEEDKSFHSEVVQVYGGVEGTNWIKIQEYILSQYEGTIRTIENYDYSRMDIKEIHIEREKFEDWIEELKSIGILVGDDENIIPIMVDDSSDDFSNHESNFIRVLNPEVLFQLNDKNMYVVDFDQLMNIQNEFSGE